MEALISESTINFFSSSGQSSRQVHNFPLLLNPGPLSTSNTYSEVRDFKFLKASAAIDRISLLLKSLQINRC